MPVLSPTPQIAFASEATPDIGNDQPQLAPPTYTLLFKGSYRFLTKDHTCTYFSFMLLPVVEVSIYHHKPLVFLAYHSLPILSTSVQVDGVGQVDALA